MALLDRVEFIPLFGHEQFEALRTGGADAITPEVSHYAGYSPGASLLDCIPELCSPRGKGGNLFEALWFNAHERPLTDPLVREALMYAIDRQEVVDRLISLYDANPEVLNCGFLGLPNSEWCRIKPFERFIYDPAHALALLRQAGYRCSSVPCTKRGKPLEVQYFTTSTNALETTTEETLFDQARPAGFQLKAINYEGAGLFGPIGDLCPWRFMAITACHAAAPPDGAVTRWFGCDQIPGRANGYLGGNAIRWCNREADRLMKESDRELDPARRLDLLDRVYELEAEDMIGLPLYAVPVVVVWRVQDVAGPIDRYLSSPYGPFFNISEWHLPAP